MGKNLKGKECGKGISQRKDGLYSARYVDELGKRHDKYFPTLPEARNWLKQAKEAPLPQDDLFIPNEMTVDTWFEFWINNIVGDLAPNTRRNYRERYKHNIQPVLGKMRLVDVKPMYCKMVLNRMEATYAGSTIRQTYIAMGTMFKSAVMNGLISKHPMDGVRFNKPVRAVDDIHFLTVDEQEKFLEVAKRSHNYLQYALILETGLRTGELIGLTWDAIDWEKRTLTVNKALEFRHKQQEWRAGPPKTKHSYRTLPLTNRAYEILRAARDKWETGKKSDTLSKVLPYIDLRTGQENSLVMQALKLPWIVMYT
jgi:integrase